MSTSQTVLAALKNVIANRKLRKNMLFHSDRGVQYCSKLTVNYLNALSMSRKGNCWDNAVAESFFKSFKSELIYGYNLKKETTKIRNL